ncbi:E3 ubiquitin-protein ligase PRT6-like [Telopea speciosissima]|uniref:E3 ubiquitin-protein ligase PRT6-like n=1 Tax=Telopea speciosissima TaxID=54955 RepID=UPI001CC64A91|nr:E3 ubiquitin-protein ligase PRT6-like [Telopea speciosissima]XP_043702923.1 E3 ubiquitin-protein ligase PRT6-like [Telopea speciosissima]XP_043702924.1 E3 ubiquitin-protein ligase PRT6-like [Telopea speciosissima]
MEVDSPTERNPLSLQDRIVQRLLLCGVPLELLDRLQPGLVSFVKENKSQLPEFVSTILPTDEELLDEAEFAESGGVSRGSSLKNLFGESLLWMQWLMFEDEPHASLKNLAKMSVGQRGVCGAVWGHNDIAYRCRTCEHDPTCAICVPCFQNGNHKDHDYSIMYTGGGCCDCGDATAWKREGFCSKHKGTEQIQPLPEKMANSVGPVLDILFIYWKDKLVFAETFSRGNLRVGDHASEHRKVANEWTLAVVEMLIEFCKHSESLLSFISRRLFFLVGLLDILVRAERFLDTMVVKKLHELLLKLLGDPIFKYEFAKVYVNYYPVVINEAIKKSSDSIVESYPLLNTFSVQIFTVPTLTPRLVKEMNLLGVLLGCLGDIFLYCSGEDGNLQVSRLASLYATTVRVVEDTRFVMSHVEVPKYITRGQPDIARTWMRLLAFVQGMNTQKRVTGLHVEEDNENVHMPFVLGHYIACIHSLLVAGAFPVCGAEGMKDDALVDKDKQNFDDTDDLRHAKVGRLSQESSVCSTTGRSITLECISKDVEEKVDTGHHCSVPSSVSWLIFECLRAIDSWLPLNVTSGAPFNFLSPDTGSGVGSSFSLLRRTLSKIRKGKYSSKVYRAPSARIRSTTYTELHGLHGSSSSCSGFVMSSDLESQMLVQDSSTTDPSEMDVECASSTIDPDKTDLQPDCAADMEALRVLSLPEWPDLSYDVSSQDVSVHIPLHRLLSMLIYKALSSCYAESLATEMNDASSTLLSRPCHDFSRQVLVGCHPNGFSAFVMEHPLRIRVFCAQVRAGMWRKNGDAAILSCELYRSVRWSEQCLEPDLFLMQCCAALAPPDLYVKRIIECFGLSNYLSLNLERPNEYEPVLVQEMLTLIIQIVKERRFCGFSTAESLQRELVYKLAIGDATHSQVVKSLPPDLSKSDQMQKILDVVAVYSNPSGMKQGKYSLQKTYWKELDLYHPRWNSRDLQISEERYLRFCKVSALTNQLPRWTKLFYSLQGIARIATSKTVLQIVRAVLFYAVVTDKTSASRAPDGVIVTALHLLSLALDICYLQKQSGDNSSMSTSFPVEDLMVALAFAREEIDVGATAGMNEWRHQSMLSLLVSLMKMHHKESLDSFIEVGNCNLSSLIEGLLKKFAELDSGCMTELQRIAPEVVSHLVQSILDVDSRVLRSASEAEVRKAKARERQAAILEKMRAAQSNFMANHNSTAIDLLDDSKSKHEVIVPDDNHVSGDPAPVICSLCRDPDSKSPVSFLILLQKSRLVSFIERGPPSWDQLNQSGQERPTVTTNQDAVNDFGHDGLRGGVNAILDFLKAQRPDVRDIHLPSASTDTNMNTSSFEMIEGGVYQSIKRDLHDSLLHVSVLDDNQKSTASYAVEQSKGSDGAESALLEKYIASLSGETSEYPSGSKISLSRVENVSSKSSIWFAPFDGFGPSDCDGIHISSCGHAVHQECRDRYLLSLKERYSRRLVFEGGHIVDPDQGEFLCPVCRRLANSVLPALPDYSGNIRKPIMSSDLCSTLTSSSSSTSNSEVTVLCLRQAIALLQSTSNVVGKGVLLKAFSLQRNKRMRHVLEPVFRILAKLYFADRHEKFAVSGRLSHSMVLWDTLRYSVMSTEIAARGRRSYMCSLDSTSGLYKELESSSGFILSLLLQVVQSTRSEDSVQVLLRFRGIQLLAEAVCSGVSMDDVGSGTVSQRGDMLSILKHVDKGVIYPDIQFWKRAADPVLAHDPFSSLMLVLFCLPRPFLSSMESFIPLVHLFYVVCVIQAVITLCGSQLDLSSLQLGDCPIINICKIIGKSVIVRKYFVSNYTDSSVHPKDMIRRFTFPYLRRCALLWKLLSSSMSTPFCDKSHVWDRSSPHTDNDKWERTCDLSMELKEIEQLENMFKIPSLDVVLKDALLHTMVLKWFNHFFNVFEVRSYGRALHSAPMVAFKLMRLPHLYQDLLQRYIKQQCPDCEVVQDEPALCLLCGRLCSPTWKPCCRESSCQTHAMACGAGIGVFLLIRRTTILLQRSARQSPWPSPYLDSFGEEDIEMLRGKPLYLNEERYTALTHMVASHGLDRSSEVLRQTTIDSPFLM